MPESAAFDWPISPMGARLSAPTPKAFIRRRSALKKMPAAATKAAFAKPPHVALFLGYHFFGKPMIAIALSYRYLRMPRQDDIEIELLYRLHGRALVGSLPHFPAASRRRSPRRVVALEMPPLLLSDRGKPAHNAPRP